MKVTECNRQQKNQTLFVASLVLAAVLSACAKQPTTTDQGGVSAASSDSDIIGGVVVADNDPISKTVVAVYDNQQKTLCTASILSANLVVTAGHCFNQDPTQLVLIFNTKLPTPGGPKPTLRQVVDGRVNPRFLQVDALFKKNRNINPDSVKDWGDISLLKFSGGLPPGYAPAQILNDASQLKNGLPVLLAGYGEMNGPQHVGSDSLRKVMVTLADAKFAATEVEMDQRQGRGACHGDSGGPAYVTVGGRQLLFGVTSRGDKDAKNDCSQFAVYTNILAQMAWLNQQAKDLNKVAVK